MPRLEVNTDIGWGCKNLEIGHFGSGVIALSNESISEVGGLIFFGRVLPERVPVKMSNRISTASQFTGLGFSYRSDICIADSQIIVTVNDISGNVDIDTMKNCVEDDVRAVVDFFGYCFGISFDVEIISAVTNNVNYQHFFGINIPVISKRRAAPNPITLDPKAMSAIIFDMYGRMVLSDFREAIRMPIGTGFFCYRAIETIMQSMKAADDEKETISWERLRKNLHIDRSVLMYLKKFADFPRHGKPSDISNYERGRIFELSDVILQRYFRYIIEGKIELTEQEFPLFQL